MRHEEHLLLVPSGNPERLLGREVRGNDEQGWTVEKERRPGCTVRTWEEAASWKRSFREDIGHAADIALGHQELGGLVARFGREIVVQATIENQKTLHADLSGDCGQQVIDAVHVGVGHRSLRRGNAGGVMVQGPVAVSAARGGVGAHHEVESELAWQTPQAWAFSVTELGDVARPDVHVKAPTRMSSHEEVRVSVRADRTVWLVVVFRSDAGDVGVLVPNERTEELVSREGNPVSLPAMEAVHSGRSDEPEYETLEVYAFSEREDFQRIRPPRGVSNPQDAARYVRTLEASLDALPLRRWSRSTLRYEIAPEPRGRTP
ncbi:hypothetical protein [Paraliomyxa miuraensis]|uniref:hypothetical protein n=1 Tax=Paraliomyxa miuraensis TaxID=376150 RepID=UPI0022576A33|nr:hypothetical protein [Paraliomyxa miuraensis]MCX4239414.1 hypothetical protein [Paraliomyxa miuraensis]